MLIESANACCLIPRPVLRSRMAASNIDCNVASSMETKLGGGTSMATPLKVVYL